MNYETLIIEKIENICSITINRPSVYNALNHQVLKDLDQAIQDIEDDPDIGAFILTGAGSKAFVSGADINELNGVSPVRTFEWMLYGQKVFSKIENCRKPSIAAVNGYALGGGCELALSCDIRLASSNAKFGQAEIKLGNIPGWGGTQRLPRLIGIGLAKEMVLTGAFVAADRAYEIGLCNHVYNDQTILRDEAVKMAKIMASKGPVSIALGKSIVNFSSETSIEAGLMLEASGVAICMSTADQKEGVSAFLEKRQPAFKGE